MNAATAVPSRHMPIAGACVAALLALAPALPAFAEPVELKFAFFAPEATDIFRYGIKPFVDAVNAEGQGVVSIKVYADGKLGKSLAEQSQMVLSGAADIAWVVPGQTPYRFPDNEALELPGLFHDVRDGTLVYTRLAAAGALRGYENFYVVAAFAVAPGLIHSRTKIGSIADLAGLKIRTNNAIEADALNRLGALPTVMPASMVSDALGKGALDAAILSPAGLFQFGGPQATNHYLLTTGSAPLVILMSRKRFDSLPESAKTLIRKYSGDRAAAAWIESYGGSETRSIERIKSDPDRKAVEPSAADREAARRVYDALIEAYAAKSPHSRQLVTMISAELATIRSGSR
ncbi:MAG TPA: TRAP transporter substrate-binding protein DctP [Pseudolabrys sp.]|jgi:TRAP-type C4-dicarboxylate transport system substrate-binding protein|nr:TRAP transporter substrate-binding protein DctP [Pseudolabrys sp.]